MGLGRMPPLVECSKRFAVRRLSEASKCNASTNEGLFPNQWTKEASRNACWKANIANGQKQSQPNGRSPVQFSTASPTSGVNRHSERMKEETNAGSDSKARNRNDIGASGKERSAIRESKSRGRGSNDSVDHTRTLAFSLARYRFITNSLKILQEQPNSIVISGSPIPFCFQGFWRIS